MSSPLRVVHLCETGGIGGAETVLLKLIQHLDSQKIESRVVLMRDGWLARKLQALGHSPLVLPSTRGYDVRFVWCLRGIARGFKADVIHAHLPDANVYACLAGLVARVPVIATYHGLIVGPTVPEERGRFKLRIVRRLAHRVVAVSSALRNQLITMAAFPPEITRTIHNGVYWEPFDGKFDTDRLRSELGIADGERVIGIVANLRPAKGYEYLIRAFAVVAGQIPGLRLLIVGEEEQGIRSALQREIDRLGLSDCVRFMGARDDIPAILQVFEIFVLSSISEGMSIATVEAMGAGRPVIVTRSGGPEDIVRDGETGLLVPPADDRALSNAMIRLLRDRPLARRLAEAAQRDVRERFSVEKMVAQYTSLYEECAR